MKTPSGTFIVIMLAMIGIVSVVIFQGCVTGPDKARQDNTYSLTIGKDPDIFVDLKDDPNEGKNRFDAVLRKLHHHKQYTIQYKKDDLPGTVVDPDYTPPPKPNVSLKTDNVTTAALAKNEPIGDPSITKQVQSNNIVDIQEVLNSLKK